jgi:DNA-binding response OmpR family regulator
MTPPPVGSILLVESDPGFARALAEQLTADGFRVSHARSAEHARVLAGASPPTLAVLGGLDSPRGAQTLLEEIRGPEHGDTPWDRALPTILLGHHAQEPDMLRAFDAGADDFLCGPAGYLELRARLRAILRRAAGGFEQPRMLYVGPLAIDASARSVSLDGRALSLRRLEFELLVHLARDPERVFAKEELLRTIWGHSCHGSSRTVDSHASRLRRKLDIDRTGCWVINVWGVGYRLM